MHEEFDIAAWIKRSIEGPGGMNDYEDREVVVWHQPERIAAATWIVRCLGNPRCEGSRQAVEALMRRHGIIAEGGASCG